MGVIEIVLGYKKIDEKKVNKGIIKIVEKKLRRHHSKYKRDIPKVIFLINGKNFKYKIKCPGLTYIDNHGHGGYIGTGEERVYYSKKRF